MKLPYGYVLIDGEITVQEEKADVVRSIFGAISPEPAWARSWICSLKER